MKGWVYLEERDKATTWVLDNRLVDDIITTGIWSYQIGGSSGEAPTNRHFQIERGVLVYVEGLSIENDL